MGQIKYSEHLIADGAATLAVLASSSSPGPDDAEHCWRPSQAVAAPVQPKRFCQPAAAYDCEREIGILALVGALLDSAGSAGWRHAA